MVKRLFCFQNFFYLIFSLFVLCGCRNNNIFSWAQGSYASSMSAADSEMQSRNYEKAAEYYKSAIKNKPGDKDAVMGYASAAMSAAGMDITNFVISDASLQNLIPKILGDKATRICKLLKELTNDTNMFPSLFEGPTHPTDFTSNFNGDVICALTKELTNDTNMFPSLFEGPTHPTDFTSNFNGAVIYALTAIVVLVRTFTDLTDLNKINLDAIRKSLDEANSDLSKAKKCLSNIDNIDATMEDFGMKLQTIEDWLSKIQQVSDIIFRGDLV
jgi:tetratricopeptide (TPR) repeat protein